MADIGVPQNWLVSTDKTVERKWLDVQIQEKKSRIVRYKQDIEDLTKGKIVDLEAKVLMLEKEVKFLEVKRENVGKNVMDADVVK
jgi:hypothetical protein